jgi:hypothetical protein
VRSILHYLVLFILCALVWLAYGIRQELAGIGYDTTKISEYVQTICNHGQNVGPCGGL